jgi:hypothetical protein
MSLLYKPDWEETKQRYLSWWAREPMGRCAMAVYAPLKSPPPGDPPVAPADVTARWTDLEYICRANEYRHSRTFYGGEAFPVWHGGYPGHTCIAAFLGCPVTLKEETGWLDPILVGPEPDICRLKINKKGRWWKFAIQLLKTAAEASKGKSIPTIGAFGGSGDTLAAVRGNEQLLYDVADRPDWVREADMYLMDMWCEVYDAFYDIIHESAQGSTCWFEMWSPGKFYASQNDFSYMLSPRTFRDIFLPAVQKQTEFLDHSVYHVDGVSAFAHVDALCELPRLGALQILPGAGKPSPLHYMDTLKKVQSRGKNLHITIPANEVETALRELSARGLFIHTWCATEEEARQLLKDAEKWSHD